MTREEAIKAIQDILDEATADDNAVCYVTKIDEEPLKIAIKALKQELCEDCISRQAVLDIDFKRIILTTAKPAELIEQKVKALPPVTPQPDELKVLKEEAKVRREDKGVLEQLAEEQNSLLATVKAWSDAIEKNGYVN